MAPNEWIEFALISSGGFERGAIESALRDAHNGDDEHIEIARFPADGGVKTEFANAQKAAEICRKEHDASVTIELSGFTANIGPNHKNNVLSNHPHLLLRVNRAPFRRPRGADYPESATEGLRNQLVELLKTLCENLNPEYGFGLRGGLQLPEGTELDDLIATHRPPLYEYNLFNEHVVDSIGRKMVTSAPAWHVEELVTGDVLLITREPPYSCSPQEEPCIEVAEHLGLSIPDLS